MPKNEKGKKGKFPLYFEIFPLCCLVYKEVQLCKEINNVWVGVGFRLGLNISIPNVSGGWGWGVGVDYHYTNAHFGPNPQVFPTGPSVAKT